MSRHLLPRLAVPGLALVLGGSCLATTLPPGFVRLAEVSKAIRQEIRYAGAENFTGRPVAGYGAPECWLKQETAEALARVAGVLARSGWRLIVYDCYRPQRAVSAFAAWAADETDQARKSDYYPRIDKRELFALGYIAATSSHSKGTAVDAGAEAVDGAGNASALDFGTPFDRFDPSSAGASREVGAMAAANRRRLAAAFKAQGFAAYSREWWHFGFKGAARASSYDVPIAAEAK